MATADFDDAIPMTEPALRGKDGLYSASKLGIDPSTCSAEGFSAKALYEGPRFADLAQKERYFRGQQHDHKVFDAYQRLQKAPSGVQPLMGSIQSSSYIALDQRRPCAPYRLTRETVKGFTSFVFGRGRWPSIKVTGDAMTQAFAEALVRAARMPLVMLRARNLGGAVGTVGLSWRYWEGSPRVQVHNARTLVVHEWADREQLIPAHVSEITQYTQEKWNAVEKRSESVVMWRRRDWTEQADVAFVDVPSGDDPEWVIDDTEGATFVHGDGFCHFVWVQNLPDLDGSCEDGEADLETLYDGLDMADVVSSVLALGGAQNLDPTLVLGIDKDDVAGSTISKGSDNAVVAGKGGTATYLTLPSDLITAGKELLGELVRQVRDVAGYVKPDPDKIAAAGTSGRAIELLYGPMVQVGDTLREQYGRAIEQLLEQMIASARRRMPLADDETGELSYPVEVTAALEGAEEGEEEVNFFVKLPPLVTEEDVLDANEQPTGEKRVVVTELHPGQGGDVELEWGPYFPPSDADLQAKATALGTAAGGKPILAQQTAVELLAVSLGRDPAVEWTRMQAQIAREASAQGGMFPPAGNPGGEGVTTPPQLQEQGLPEGGEGEEEAAPEEQPPPPPNSTPDVIPDNALNGAQVTAALAIVQAVAEGALPRDTGLGQLKVFFNLTDAQAAEVMGSVGTPQAPARVPAPPA